jgi:hypothetical protein
LTEITQLLAGARDGKSTEVFRRLAERKLPDVDSLIERAQTMKEWLELAADCRCASLDVCDLFAADDPSNADHVAHTAISGTSQTQPLPGSATPTRTNSSIGRAQTPPAERRAR